MKWSNEANKALSKVPFFVKKRVKKRVEEEAARLRAAEVTIEHVRTCQKRFLNKMEDEVRGFQVETCFGPTGCPNRAVISDGLPQKLEKKLLKRNLKGFLKKRVNGPLNMHHEFRIGHPFDELDIPFMKWLDHLPIQGRLYQCAVLYSHIIRNHDHIDIWPDFFEKPLVPAELDLGYFFQQREGKLRVQ